MGPTWVLSAPDESHVGPMNLAIRDVANIGSSQQHFFMMVVFDVKYVPTNVWIVKGSTSQEYPHWPRCVLFGSGLVPGTVKPLNDKQAYRGGSCIRGLTVVLSMSIGVSSLAMEHIHVNTPIQWRSNPENMNNYDKNHTLLDFRLIGPLSREFSGNRWIPFTNSQ